MDGCVMAMVVIVDTLFSVVLWSERDCSRDKNVVKLLLVHDKAMIFLQIYRPIFKKNVYDKNVISDLILLVWKCKKDRVYA